MLGRVLRVLGARFFRALLDLYAAAHQFAVTTTGRLLWHLVRGLVGGLGLGCG